MTMPRRWFLGALGASVGAMAISPIQRFALGVGLDTSPASIAYLLASAEPYLHQGTDHATDFDPTRAAARLTPAEIGLISQVVALNNAIVVSPSFLSRRPTAPVVAFLEPFYLAMTHGDRAVLDAFRRGHLRSQAVAGGRLASPMLAHCSGGNYVNLSYENPAFCPTVNRIYGDWPNQQAVINYLVGQGFHEVPRYASGTYGRDYARPIYNPSYPGCDQSWAFREQAIAADSSQVTDFWFYWYQQPEPNPEVLSYGWPEVWWGDYVHWWHSTYC